MLPAANSMPDTYSGEGTTGIQTHSVLLPAGSAVPDLTKVDGPARLQQKQVTTMHAEIVEGRIDPPTTRTR